MSVDAIRMKTQIDEDMPGSSSHNTHSCVRFLSVSASSSVN